MPFPWSEQYNAIEIIKIYWKEVGMEEMDSPSHTEDRKWEKSKKILLYTINSVLLKYRVQQ